MKKTVAFLQKSVIETHVHVYCGDNPQNHPCKLVASQFCFPTVLLIEQSLKMQCMKKRMDFIDNYSSLHGPFHSFCPQGFLRRIMYRCCRLNKLKSPSPIVTSRKQPRKCNNFNHMHRVSIVKTFIATCSSLEKVQITDMLHVIIYMCTCMYMYVLLSVKTSKLSTQFTEFKV